jgi:predicted secreted protein
MTVTTALATFFLIWWVTLFAVLPWGIRSQHEAGERHLGTDPGAPASFGLGRKLLWTTIVAVAIYAVLFLVYTRHLVTLDQLTAPIFGKNR